MTAARALVEVVARRLVDQPDEVVVTEREHRDGVFVEVQTAAGDLGKMIGRQGRTASAVRTLANIVAEEGGFRATVDFVDE